MACPADKAELKLDIPNSDDVSEGEYICSECSEKYEIREGVPYFFRKGNGFEWTEDMADIEIAESIAGTIMDKGQTWSKIMSLGGFLMRKTMDRKKSIDDIFSLISAVVELTGADKDAQAYLTQAGTAARYDIEVYRGTFMLSDALLQCLAVNYKNDKGIIAEGACATGECLTQLAKNIDSGFYLGLDISGNMARIAQKTATGNTLFVQGDICSLPIKENALGIYVLNNVFDRVIDPVRACEQADLALSNKSYMVLSNCDPLQFEYKTDNGKMIVFVPVDRQLSLEQGLRRTGFKEIVQERGIWQVNTAAYGDESLPYKSLVGQREER